MATETKSATALETFAREDRTFPPPKDFAAQANARDPGVYERADRDFEGFWAEQAKALLWRKPFSKVLEWDAPYAKWFLGGELNISENCLDRHVKAGKGTKVAYHWEGEPGDSRTITYLDLLEMTSRAANALKELGVQKGDRVAIYMPMIPELPAAMLACARIGAPFTVVFGGFSAEALAGRINDSEAKVLITADGGYRKGNVVPLKKNADDAIAQTKSIEKVLVVRRTKQDVPWTKGRDVWWHEIVDRQRPACPAESLDSEHMLYLLYTSGTTAKPKGIVHTTAGYLAGVAATHKLIFDVKDDDVYWCAADIGWVTGHSYIVFAPLANGTTGVIYEGTPDFPDKDRWWSIIEKYKVSILYCAPTAIRTFMKWGPEYPRKHDMRSLRLLGTVGEPINPEAWLWYHATIGGGRAPIVDTWWMTETGMILITPLPGLTTTKPGSATLPFPGVKADVVDEEGKSVPLGGAGYLVLSRPWPAMLRGIYKDDQRYRETYWTKYPGKYFAGDGARRDKDGYFWLMGRVDDVMKISGHRISTTEVESALVSHPKVAEAAVIGREDPVTTQAIFAFVTLRAGNEGNEVLSKELREHVVGKIGSIARPKTIMFTPELPKTRSGKIMRRLLRDIANGQPLGDTTTLADATVVESIRSASASGKDD
ncbi:MAG TPA: acetate--CoA ligase [Candidatus Limnocylindria bacterium]|jgi:acetyl-CoA synthetase|nr:acetate--CoA ligase [Candidatus Limnocylindria bacterium]